MLATLSLFNIVLGIIAQQHTIYSHNEAWILFSALNRIFPEEVN